jgi:hypothetical protein
MKKKFELTGMNEEKASIIKEVFSGLITSVGTREPMNSNEKTYDFEITIEDEDVGEYEGYGEEHLDSQFFFLSLEVGIKLTLNELKK